MKHLFFAFVVSASLMVTSCAKSDLTDGTSQCWYLIDRAGNQVDIKCGMSESQIARYAKSKNYGYRKKI